MSHIDTLRSLEVFTDRLWIGLHLERMSPIAWLALAGAVLLLGLARHAGLWLYAVLAMPGTVLHEASHFSVAWLIGAHPTTPSLLPTRIENGWRLGEVRFRGGWLRGLLVGSAPLLLLPLSLAWIGWILAGSHWPWYPLNLWIAAALLRSSWPSTADWKLTAPAMLLAAIAVLIVLLVR